MKAASPLKAPVNNRGAENVAGRPDAIPTEQLSMPLTEVPRGQWVELVRLECGCTLSRRLAALGLLPGSRFRIEYGGRSGPMLIAIRGVRLILGQGMASQIRVRPLKDTQG
jgi:Fe2+ transport system protein FeoA